MNKFSLYILAFFMLLAFSCKQSGDPNNIDNKTDSLISSFSWTNVKDEDKDSTARSLKKLLNKEISTFSHIKLYLELCYYHFNYKKDLPKGLLYADSVILTVERADSIKYGRELSLGYYAKGDILFTSGKYAEAYQNYYAAKKIMDAKKDNCTNGDYCYRIGMVLYRQARYVDAGYFFKKGFDEALGCKQDFPQVYREQELLNNIALCYAKQDKIDSALLTYNRALKFIDENDTIPAKKIAFNVARGVVYGNMGDEYIKKKDDQKAEQLLKQSIAINILPGHENNDAALTQIKLGELYLTINELSKTSKLLKELKVNVGKLKAIETTRKYHYLAATYLDKIGKKELAFSHLSKYVVITDSVQARLNKARETDIYERFRNLDSQNEIDYLKREKHIQNTYLYITILFSMMAFVIILLIYFYWRKSKRNVKALTQLNNEVLYQKKRLEETLMNLESSNQEKDSLLRAVAHDLRNPIGGIASLVGLMLEEDKDDEIKQQHQLIKETCINALELINELIEASEGQNTVNVSVKKTELDLVNLMTNAIELLKFKAQEKQQLIKFKVSAGSIVVNVNREKILRVISNLISNAIKFSHENTVIEVSIITDNKRAIIAVIDHGIGIPLKLRDHIFQMFTTAKRIGTQGEKSYGLGLSISKQIIKAHHGEIWFEPNENGGTSFYFSLPIDQV